MKKYVFIAVILLFFSGCSGKPLQKPDRNTYYQGMREIIFLVTPQQLELSLPEEATVYGVVTEQNVMGFFTITSAAYKTGEACEFTNGAFWISHGESGKNSGITKQFYGLIEKYMEFFNKDVTKYFKNKTFEETAGAFFLTYLIEETGKIQSLSKELINEAQKTINFDNKADSIDFPAENMVKITFLTNKGFFSAEVSVEDIETGKTPYANIFRIKNNISEEITRNSRIQF